MEVRSSELTVRGRVLDPLHDVIQIATQPLAGEGVRRIAGRRAADNMGSKAASGYPEIEGWGARGGANS